ncbi:MAG TPA: serine hydrolase, partial [Phototrophicaceae bacterium]|nr:serine hydrolase [Phototrophicaceae bacterium]
MSEFQQIEAVIQEGVQSTASAIALAVYCEGELVINQAYGVLDPEIGDQPAQVNTLFDLASITKLYTTTAFLMQVQDRKIRLDSPVVDLVPEFGHSPRPIGETQNPETLKLEAVSAASLMQPPVDPTKITFRELLTHTSGIAPWRDLFMHLEATPPAPGTAGAVDTPNRLQKALELIGSYPFVDVPGKVVRYSDLGFILLGAAVARIDGASSLAEVIEKRVLQPLELRHTMYNPPDPILCAATGIDTRWRNRRCRGEVHDENAWALGGIAGHAGLFATADDVAWFGQWWLKALTGRSDLNREIVQDAVALHAATGLDRRGMGWMLRTPGHSSSGQYFSDESFGHTGFTG